MHSSPEGLRGKPQAWLKPAGLIGVGVAAVIVAGGLVTRGLASQQLQSRALAQAEPTVDVLSPSTDDRAEALDLPGQIQANDDAVIHARVNGYLKRWLVDIGTHVRTGQLLAEIDTPELDQQLAQAKAALAVARANQSLAGVTAQRWKNLLAKDAVPVQETDEKVGDAAAKTAQMQAAQADVDRLQALEAFKRIVAPFDGVVTARNTDIGQLIAAGVPSDPGLFTVADVHRLRIYVHVPQAYSARIRPGQVAQLSVPEYPGQAFQAQVTSLSGAVGAQSGAVLAELQMDNPGGRINPGDYVQTRFSLAAAAGVVRIPASALLLRDQGMAVAVVGPDQRVTLRPIVIQRDLGSSVEIGGNLRPADRVIDNPPDSLQPGELVHLAAAREAGD